ncbi:hypothetical protein BGW37DRAFT_485139 [Umbelopsis sp. PMI_123]|nr:hypothetical protein BGW37DRAFT_485139 [Umbelopsis sp. PMI_123]
MTDKTSVEGIAIWLKQVFGSNSWMAGRVAQELNDDILEVIQTQYPTYHANIRIGLLFALLCLRKGQHQYLRDNINKTLARARKDSEEWVVVTAHALNNFPDKGGLNFDLENATDKFTDALKHVNDAIDTHGISFHPAEFAYKKKNRYPPCASASEDYNKMVPTVKKHFMLSNKASNVVSREDRLSQLQAIARESTSTTPTQAASASINAPSAAAGSTGASSENLPTKMAAGRGQPGSSLFIQRPGNRVPVRKPSIGAKPSFLRTVNPTRPTQSGSTQPRASIQSILAAGSTAPGGAEDSNTPKGFMKPSKIQMIDINESAAIHENIDKANAEAQAQNELKKLQAKQAAEERRRAAEERKLELQREREEKREKKKQETEEKKRKKELEKQEAAMQAAAAREEAKLAAAAQEAEDDNQPKTKRPRRGSAPNNNGESAEGNQSLPYENPSPMYPPIPSVQTILTSAQPPILPLSSPPASNQTHPAFFYPPRTQLPAPQHMLHNAPPNLPPIAGYPQPRPYADMNSEQSHHFQPFSQQNSRPMSDAELRMMNEYYQRRLS